MELLAVALFLVGLSLFGMEAAAPGLYLSALGIGAIAGSIILFLTSSPQLALLSLGLFTLLSAIYTRKKQQQQPKKLAKRGKRRKGR